jgi:hypothetical protein
MTKIGIKVQLNNGLKSHKQGYLRQKNINLAKNMVHKRN